MAPSAWHRLFALTVTLMDALKGHIARRGRSLRWRARLFDRASLRVLGVSVLKRLVRCGRAT